MVYASDKGHINVEAAPAEQDLPVKPPVKNKVKSAIIFHGALIPTS